ncbi:E3 ubiquitin/ISG15 ligase TRIM25-like [Rhinoderma darwinii]|uniref:E3 ubiquitin/ISG15 ligase TRIM25-like n=1 Tax=Rhinoderma darwinii TaxID=43563 RepID=UPI003F670BAF
MASADLRDELLCSICLNIYTDPVTLQCGHNFCRECIDHVLEQSGGHRCPDCRAEFPERPTLQRNIALHNIAERFHTTPPDQEDTGISCTHSPVLAVKSCVHCEAALWEEHLRVHLKSPEHVLVDPSFSMKMRKCSTHKKILDYYCMQDASDICMSCCLTGEHVGHAVVPMVIASEEKKEKMRTNLKKLASIIEGTKRKVQSLEKNNRKAKEKATREMERVTNEFRGELVVLGKEQVSLSVSDLIQQLEIKKDKLSRKMGHLEELCYMTDPLVILLEWEADQDEDWELARGGGVPDEGLILGFADYIYYFRRNFCLLKKMSSEERKDLCDIPNGVKRGAQDLVLDIDTAGVHVKIQEGLRTVSWSRGIHNYPKTSKRFRCSQVLSVMRFYTGKHKWKLETSRRGNWRMGVSYGATERKGFRSIVGNNNKSWCLLRSKQQYSVIHNGREIPLHPGSSCNLIGFILDYEVGRLSFYELCDPIRHLYTLTATFTEPLHAAVWIYNAWVRIRHYDYMSLKTQAEP